MSDVSQRSIRVLAAVSPGAHDLVFEAFGENFSVVYCSSIQMAKAALEEPVDVIIGGIHFDDCQMFNLLRHCKISARTRSIAFLCVKFLDGELKTHAYEAVDIASRALGGNGFFDLNRWVKESGRDQAHGKLRNIIQMLHRPQAQHCSNA